MNADPLTPAEQRELEDLELAIWLHNGTGYTVAKCLTFVRSAFIGRAQQVRDPDHRAQITEGLWGRG